MKLKKNVDQALEILVSTLLVVLVLNVLWQVVSRFIVGRPSPFTDELAGFLLIWVGLLGAAYASGQKQHLAINLLEKKLSQKNQIRLQVLINVLIVLFASAVMVVGGVNLAYITLYLDQISAALRIPVGMVYLVIPVSGLLIIFYAVVDSILILKTKSATIENSTT
ncbi:MAG TPA: TRAP transporter small permease [Bacteroidales bacterium]|nr:TRAP transporter small permease [Bacteroidales bacterium]